jgi:negative regulator of replication initiation
MSSRLVGASTIHFDSDLYQAMVLKAAESGESMSDLVNRAMRNLIEDEQYALEELERRSNREALGFFELMDSLENI